LVDVARTVGEPLPEKLSTRTLVLGRDVIRYPVPVFQSRCRVRVSTFEVNNQAGTRCGKLILKIQAPQDHKSHKKPQKAPQTLKKIQTTLKHWPHG
jgi:hypothetical protein